MNKLFLLKCCNKLPDWLLPKWVQHHIKRIAEQELISAKQSIIRLRWQQVKLEEQLNILHTKQKDGC